MREILSPFGIRSPFGQRRRTFSPAALFAASEPGVWLDPSDPATLFTDTAGTTQAGIGDPVALVLDKSGNGNHATQPTLASRPILREANGLRYLEFDGVDDYLQTPSITPGTDKVQVFAGVRKLSDAATGVLLEYSPTVDASNGSLIIAAPGFGGSQRYNFRSRGTSVANANVTTGFAAPTSNGLTGLGHISGNLATLRIDGVQVAQSTDNQGTGNYLAYPVFIGSRAGSTLFFNGHIYSLIVRFGPNLDTPTIERTERYVAKRTGVQL